MPKEEGVNLVEDLSLKDIGSAYENSFVSPDLTLSSELPYLLIAELPIPPTEKLENTDMVMPTTLITENDVILLTVNDVSGFTPEGARAASLLGSLEHGVPHIERYDLVNVFKFIGLSGDELWQAEGSREEFVERGYMVTGQDEMSAQGVVRLPLLGDAGSTGENDVWVTISKASKEPYVQGSDTFKPDFLIEPKAFNAQANKQIIEVAKQKVS